MERIGAVMEWKWSEREESENRKEDRDKEEGSKGSTRESQEERIPLFISTRIVVLYFNNIFFSCFVYDLNV